MPRSGRALVLTDIERRVALREIVGFETLSVEAVAAVASLSRRESFPPGATLVRADQTRSSAQLLLHGDLQLWRDGRRWSHPLERSVMDLFWLARDSQPLEVKTAGGADVLQVPFAGLEDLLEEHFSLYLATAQMLASSLLAAKRAASEPVDIRADHRHATLSGRLEAIGDSLPFALPYVDALLQLETDADQLRFDAGKIIWRPGDAADSLLVLLDGALRGSRGEGSAIGGLELVAQHPRVTQLETARPSMVLRISQESLLDLLEDHDALARDMLARLAAALVRHLDSERSGDCA